MNFSHVVVIDVGGTKTVVSLINKETRTIDWVIKEQTVPGLEFFPKFLSECIDQAFDYAKKHQFVTGKTIFIGLPGNFEMGFKIKYKQGSGRQLLSQNESFDGVNVNDWLCSKLNKDIVCWVVNDALAQAVGGVLSTWNNDYCNKTVLYVGPGTGLGGAIVKFGNSVDDITLVTDGHIYDILVELENGSVAMAEDVFSGRAFFELTGRTALELNTNDNYWDQYEDVIQYVVDASARLVQQLLDGNVQKRDLNNNWSIDDINQVKTISLVMLGGSIGTKGRLGELLFKSLSSISQVMVIQMKDSELAALLGIYHLQTII